MGSLPATMHVTGHVVSPHLESWLAAELPPVVVDVAVIIQYVDELQAVALAHVEVIGVMSRRDLHSTWAGCVWGGGGMEGDSMCASVCWRWNVCSYWER